MNRSEIIKEIDETITLYCNDCFLRSYYRKAYSKTYAHQFCILQCTVGETLREKGAKLLISK